MFEANVTWNKKKRPLHIRREEHIDSVKLNDNKVPNEYLHNNVDDSIDTYFL